MQRLCGIWLLGWSVCMQAQSVPGASGTAPAKGSSQTRRSSYNVSQDSYSGSVVSGTATSDELGLSLSDAISRGLKYNLGMVYGEQETRIARAETLRALSSLLPDLSLGVNETSQQVSLKAFGFSGFPGIPSVVGPFQVFDARAYLSGPILQIAALRNRRAQRENERAAQLSYRDARDIVVLTVANFYLATIAGAARIDSARGQLTTAQALYTQAVDLKNAGVVAGIDVIRADVERQAIQQRVLFFENEWERAKLRLARAIGLPLDQRLRLSDTIGYHPPPALTPEAALAKAYDARPDYQASLASLRSAQEARGAAAAQRYPSVEGNLNYGAIGPTLTDSHGTYTATLGVRVPVFTGGRIRADVEMADAAVARQRAESEDLRGRIAFEVRSALLDVNSSSDQVKVATAAVDLAAQQLTQARDRFAAGVSNSLEVVQSQEAVATANDNYIAALYSYNSARAALARAVGAADETAKQLLGAP